MAMIGRNSGRKPPEMERTACHGPGGRMGTDQPGRGGPADLCFRCLASLEADRIDDAKRLASRIDDPSLRTLAEDQIRFVLQIKACLANGDKDQARRLSRCLIGGLNPKDEAALGNRPVHRTRPTPPSRQGVKKPSPAEEASRPQPDSIEFPIHIRAIVDQLMQRVGRSRAGGRPTEFSPAVLLQLGWIAHRAWRRSLAGTGFSPLRADATEIRVAGACLRQRIDRGGGGISLEDLAGELGLSQGGIRQAARNLRQFLLRGSGWRMVGDAKTGFAIEPDDADILPTDRSHGAGGGDSGQPKRLP